VLGLHRTDCKFVPLGFGRWTVDSAGIAARGDPQSPAELPRRGQAWYDDLTLLNFTCQLLQWRRRSYCFLLLPVTAPAVSFVVSEVFAGSAGSRPPTPNRPCACVGRGARFYHSGGVRCRMQFALLGDFAFWCLPRWRWNWVVLVRRTELPVLAFQLRMSEGAGCTAEPVISEKKNDKCCLALNRF